MILYRNIILFAVSLVFMLTISILSNYLYSNKVTEIKVVIYVQLMIEVYHNIDLKGKLYIC